MEKEEEKITETEFDTAAQLITKDLRNLNSRFETLFYEAMELSRHVNNLRICAEQDPHLMIKAVELSARPDMVEYTRLLAAFMYIKHPTDKTTVENLRENIQINNDREHKK